MCRSAGCRNEKIGLPLQAPLRPAAPTSGWAFQGTPLQQKIEEGSFFYPLGVVTSTFAKVVRKDVPIGGITSTLGATMLDCAFMRPSPLNR